MLALFVSITCFGGCVIVSVTCISCVLLMIGLVDACLMVYWLGLVSFAAFAFTFVVVLIWCFFLFVLLRVWFTVVVVTDGLLVMFDLGLFKI